MTTRTLTHEEQESRIIEDKMKEDEVPAEVTLPEETKFEFRTPGFSRMRTEWRREDHEVLISAQRIVDERIQAMFADAYQVMFEVYSIVRTAETDPVTGETVVDRFGFPVWKRLPSGAWEEDFGRLTTLNKEHLMFLLTTHLWDWEQRAADVWGEAMFAKAQWAERHAIAYDSPKGRLTIEDRTAKADADSAEERYFAIFFSLLSRRADAITRSMERLSQRIKDSLVR